MAAEKKGLFFTLEGIDGAGKGTQLARLEARLRGLGYAVHTTCEPTTSSIGTLLRRALQKEEKLSSQAIASLFAADRMEHLYGQNGILSLLEKGYIVLCDRFFLSNLAYNRTDDLSGRQLQWLLDINQPALGQVTAHLYLNISVDAALARIASRGGERELFETREKLTQVTHYYNDAITALQHHETIYTINAEGSTNDVHERIFQAIQQHMQ